MVEAGAQARSYVAAVDLGSNSFHMVIARQTGHDLQILDRIKEPVRLAEGLGPDGTLDEVVQERALVCLRRFGERLQNIPPDRVRAVGTNTLRLAKQAPGFRVAARAALGHTIEVISGAEEARLIYLGVAHTTPARRESRLVVDIGGGSTELIAGKDFDVALGASLYMGCVTFSQRYFPQGRLTREDFRRAQQAALLELQTVREPLLAEGWERCLGTSGTIEAIGQILRANQFVEDEITRRGLKKLRKAMIGAGHVDAFSIEGLRSERKPVLAGGLAILLSVFKALEIETMRPSPGALREGVLYDLLGRIQHEDVRDRTIRRMVEQYRVDLAQSARVHNTVCQLFDAVRESWQLLDERNAQVLRWAAQLHEVGLAVAHTSHHKHGAYLLHESEMPGFSRDDQALLAAIVRGHRRKLRREYFAELPAHQQEPILRSCVLLRLAVLLNRGRRPAPRVGLRVEDAGTRLVIEFAEDWLEEHPLTRIDLEQEAQHLASVGLQLSIGHSTEQTARTIG